MIPHRLTSVQRGVVALLQDMHLGADQAQPVSTIEERYDALRDYAFDVERELAEALRRITRSEHFAGEYGKAESDEQRFIGMLSRPQTSIGNEAKLADLISKARERKELAFAQLLALYRPVFPSHPSAA